MMDENGEVLVEDDGVNKWRGMRVDSLFFFFIFILGDMGVSGESRICYGP